MTLKEMAAQYRDNIIPWRARAAALRQEIAICVDAQQRLTLEQHLRMTMQVCREGLAAAHTMETYYEGRRDPYVPKEESRPLSKHS